MSQLRVLMIDDSQDDCDLLLLELRRSGYTTQSLRVDTAAELTQALDQPWDVVISDYSMPHFNLFSALEMVQQRGLDAPFIIVSGAIGEETAVRAMKAGASDFLMKDKIARLVPVIERSLREADMRRERHRAEAEVVHARQYLASVFNSLSSVLITATREGAITQWNAAAERYTGLDAAFAIGRDIADAVPWFAGFRQQLSDVVSAHATRQFKTVQECSCGTVYFDVSLFPLDVKDASDVVIRMDDMTELELKEQQLRQAQKMEIVGMLAGGLAHDFNNVLCGIIGSLSILRSKVKSAERIAEDQLEYFLELMSTAGSRAIDLVKQLLSLSRRKECLVVPLDLGKAISQALDLCRNTFDRCVEIRSVLPSGKAIISGDPTQIEQVLLNLLVNAYHAMTIMRREGQPPQGVLTVAVSRVDAHEPFIRNHPQAEAAAYWKLSVTDTGVGMSRATLEKIFDPFFTTKDKERGTGLGLVMVYTILKQHGGMIDVISEVGLGTTFNVYLPEAVEETPSARAQGAQPVPRGQGLVVVVDDDPLIRQVGKAILEECGYSVLLAEDGLQAIELFKTHRKDIRALLIDVIMPRKTCRDTFLALKEIDPQVKVIIISGIAGDVRIQELLKLGAQGFIPKPLTLERIGRTLHEVLSSRQSS